jgi:hypothetical protein
MESNGNFYGLWGFGVWISNILFERKMRDFEFDFVLVVLINGGVTSSVYLRFHEQPCMGGAGIR